VQATGIIVIDTGAIQSLTTGASSRKHWGKDHQREKGNKGPQGRVYKGGKPALLRERGKPMRRRAASSYSLQSRGGVREKVRGQN